MKAILNHLYEHKTLSRNEAREVLTRMAKGEYNHVQIASFISVYLMRSITVEELSGFREALLDLCIRVDLSDYDTIDLCGTGGDGKDTFNISTLTSFVVAGAGAKVAKHGNYAVSSTCGSSNVMEYLGYKFSNERSKLEREIEKTGICFLHAPLFNPAMKNVAPVRKELAVKTFFNMLGPLVNPSFPNRQMVGVYNLNVARVYNYLLQQTAKQYMIIYSLDGYDEISLTGPFKMISNEGEQDMHPEELGLQTVEAKHLTGGASVGEAVAIFKNILEGKGTAVQHDVVVANAALGLKTYYPDRSLEECLEMAADSLESGKAGKILEKLIKMAQ